MRDFARFWRLAPQTERVRRAQTRRRAIRDSGIARIPDRISTLPARRPPETPSIQWAFDPREGGNRRATPARKPRENVPLPVLPSLSALPAASTPDRRRRPGAAHRARTLCAAPVPGPRGRLGLRPGYRASPAHASSIRRRAGGLPPGTERARNRDPALVPDASPRATHRDHVVDTARRADGVRARRIDAAAAQAVHDARVRRLRRIASRHRAQIRTIPSPAGRSVPRVAHRTRRTRSPDLGASFGARRGAPEPAERFVSR